MPLLLDWNDFDQAVARIADQCQREGLAGVYGVPRGGLPLAVALSHRLGLPLVTVIAPDVLVVDDIHDSGQTLRELRQAHGERLRHVWVWATRESVPYGYQAVLTAIGSAWIIFPWEDAARAEADRQAYEVNHGH